MNFLSAQTRCLAMLALFVTSAWTHAQAPADTPASLQRAEMKKLDFLVGEWKGESSIVIGTEKRRSNVSEKIEKRLNGLALIIEGVGSVKQPDGGERIVHHALAMVNYDESTQKYRFMSQIDKGYFTNADATIEDGAFCWRLKNAQMGDVRYQIRLTADGKWSETGEYSRDGKNWTPFFECLLTKVR